MFEQPFRKGGEATFTRLGGPRHPFGAEGQVDVFQRGESGRRMEGLGEVGGKLFALRHGGDDGVTSLVQRTKPFAAVTQGGEGHLVEAASGLLAIAGHEGDGAPLVEKLECRTCLCGRDAQVGGEAMCDRVVWNRFSHLWYLRLGCRRMAISSGVEVCANRVLFGGTSWNTPNGIFPFP